MTKWNCSLGQQKLGLKGTMLRESFPSTAKTGVQGSNTWRIVPLNGEN